MGKFCISKGIFMAVIVLIFVTSLGVTAKEPEVNPAQYLLTMESKEEVALLGNDDTGTTFSLDSKVVFEGKSSVKVIPGGKALITKVTLPLRGEESIKQWIAGDKVAINIYLPEKNAVLPTEFYLGLVDVTLDRQVIETVGLDKNNTRELKPGWNSLYFDISDSFLKEISADRKYDLYFSFIGFKNNKRTPLKESFYIDGLYMVAPLPQVKSDHLWTMETADEISKYSNDNTGAKFELSTDYIAEGKNSCKVIPSGSAIETKIALNLDGQNAKAWNGHQELIINFYVPDDCELTNYFLGMADCTNGWEWVDGLPSPHKGTKGWNKVHYPLTPKMKQVNPQGKYQLYIICWGTDAGGAKVPITKPYYIDGITMDPVDYLWEMESADEIAKYGNDNTGAIFELNSEVTFQGEHSCKVIPNGQAIETKLALNLEGERAGLWNNHQELVINFYVPDGCELTNYFLGMANCTNGWEWIDGLPSPHKGTKGWNKVHYPLSEKMWNIISDGKYQIYVICWGTDASGAKVPITKPYYIDGISLAPALEH